ncbi:MAG: NAD(P)H-hydrate dehydratase [Pirellula sp.]
MSTRRDNEAFALRISKLTNRPLTAHKGSFGHALLIGGTTGMTGAIAIAGMACLRSGAGLVTLAIPEPSLNVVASFNPCYMTRPLQCDAEGRLNKQAMAQLALPIQKATCVAIGPGLGRSEESDCLVETLYRELTIPMVVDADALNALSQSQTWKDCLSRPSDSTLANDIKRILTPHPGEWERLTGVASADRKSQIAAANEVARKMNAVILLKGHRSWITDGHNTCENSTGNPSMASGGNGDCLTGIIAALLCQGLPCLEAAKLGAALHGVAGDLAHRELRSPSSLPTDLIQNLPAAFRTILES